ncbi:MAG: site-2 protease family protein [Nitrospirae bacterium]|nr:MAG: site-2 protease family protein [Nitrospirota bacterium]
MEAFNADVLRRLLIAAPAILIAITFHEVAHGFVAYKLGDPTAKFTGRLTLNPLVHIDPFGTILLPLMMYYFTNGQFVFGYAKPVPINPMNFKNPRKGMALSAAAGPVVNILLALASTLILRLLIIPLMSVMPEAASEAVLKPLGMIAISSIVVNVVLASFNMIPIPPLDGGRVLTGLLPPRQAMSFSRIEPYGFIIVLILIYTRIANYLIMPVISFFLKLFQVS